MKYIETTKTDERVEEKKEFSRSIYKTRATMIQDQGGLIDFITASREIDNYIAEAKRAYQMGATYLARWHKWKSLCGSELTNSSWRSKMSTGEHEPCKSKSMGPRA